MEITEEQRKRSEANRLAALAKLHRAADAAKQDVWKLFKCQKVSPKRDAAPPPPKMENPQAVRFRLVLEICAPDAFSITPQPVKDSPFPGRDECLQMIYAFLSSVRLHFKSFFFFFQVLVVGMIFI